MVHSHPRRAGSTRGRASSGSALGHRVRRRPGLPAGQQLLVAGETPWPSLRRCRRARVLGSRCSERNDPTTPCPRGCRAAQRAPARRGRRRLRDHFAHAGRPSPPPHQAAHPGRVPTAPPACEPCPGGSPGVRGSRGRRRCWPRCGPSTASWATASARPVTSWATCDASTPRSKNQKEAIRALKCRLSHAVYRQLVVDAARARVSGPGRTTRDDSSPA